MFRRKDRVEIKTPEQIDLMRAAGLVVARTLEMLEQAVAPGVTPRQLDALAQDSIRSHGAIPSFLGYYGYPASICTSVNDEVVHGIPGDRRLEEGDQISIDCGAILGGWHGDAAITVSVGEVDPESAELSRVTQAALWAGIAACQVGGRLDDIGSAVERSVRAAPAGSSYGIVREYVGHGIGTSMHMDPNVPNYHVPGRTLELVAGMALAIEPMVNMGTYRVKVLKDGWTAVTGDSKPSAHFEHSVVVREHGGEVLSYLPGFTWGMDAGE